MTHYDRVLGHLEKHGSITSSEAFILYGCTRLSAYIYILKKRGYEIESTIEKGVNKYGEKIHYCRYVLKEKDNG